MRSMTAYILVFGLLLASCVAPPSPGASSPTAAPPSPAAAASATGTPYPRVKLVISQAGSAVYGVAFQIAKDKGFWDKYGIDVDIVSIEGSANNTAALISGQIDVASGGGSGLISAVVAGADQIAIGASVSIATDLFVVTGDIKTAADLKGKKVGISQFGATSEFNSRRVLTSLGLDPDKDVTWVQIGGDSSRFAALRAGSIQGGLQGLGSDKTLEAAGLRVLVRLGDQKLPTTDNGVYVRKSWLAQNRDVAKRFLMGVIEATAYFKTNKQGSLDSVARWTRISDPQAVADQYDAIQPYLPRVPAVDPAALAADRDFVAGSTPAAKTLDLAKAYDASILDEIVKSGFVDKLYPK